MKTEPFIEIVFQRRNKDYGAYVLRKKQPKILLAAMLFGFFILSATLAYPIIASYYGNRHIINKDITVGADIMPSPNTEPPPPPPPPPSLEKLEAVKFVAPRIVAEDVTTDFGKQDELAGINNPAPSNETIEIIPEDKTEQILPTPAPPEIFTVVEEMPSFPGGTEALMSFLRANLKYPEQAKEVGVQGKVYVSFTVNEDGQIVNIVVLRGIGSGCDEEAIRVVSAMPKWEPGKQRGKAVRVQFNLPVKFTLQ